MPKAERKKLNMNKMIKEKINELKTRVATRSAFIPWFEVISMFDELAKTIEAADIEEAGGEFVFDDEAREWMNTLRERGLKILLPEVFLGASTNYLVIYNGEPVGNGTISNEGLSHEETAYKIAKLCNAEKVITVLEEMEATNA